MDTPYPPVAFKVFFFMATLVNYYRWFVLFSWTSLILLGHLSLRIVANLNLCFILFFYTSSKYVCVNCVIIFCSCHSTTKPMLYDYWFGMFLWSINVVLRKLYYVTSDNASTTWVGTVVKLMFSIASSWEIYRHLIFFLNK